MRFSPFPSNKSEQWDGNQHGDRDMSQERKNLPHKNAANYETSWRFVVLELWQDVGVKFVTQAQGS